jgi:lipopolysaccharide biosynthesis glycosyltransferase
MAREVRLKVSLPERHMKLAANVACTIDEGYAQHCGVMLCSLFRNNPAVDFRIFVISDGLSENAQQKLRSVAASHGQRLEIVPVDPGLLDGAPVSHHVSIATYFRILIPRLLPDDVDRVLFLDSDIIVRGSLAELYEEQIEDYTHAAVENPLSEEDLERLSIPAGHVYFNAGVLLLNLKRWRHEGLVEKILAYLKSNTDKLRYWDQDALNAILYDRWKKWPPKWNAQVAFFKNLTPLELGVSPEEFAEARWHPQVVHFTGSGPKPWSYHSTHPFTSDYYRYLSWTPWAGYCAPDRPSAGQMFRAFASRVAPKFVKQAYRRIVAFGPDVNPSA